MKIKILFISTLLLFISKLKAQQVDFIDKNSLINLFETKNDDTIRVINFWATWCGPCVKEMPYFTVISNENKNPKMKFYFVSFDMKKNKEKVEIFVLKNNMKGQNFLLTETDFNSFINKIDSTWSGSIPYTSVILNNKRTNHEGDFETKKDLQEFIKNNIK